jgi:hypothetical protein
MVSEVVCLHRPMNAEQQAANLEQGQSSTGSDVWRDLIGIASSMSLVVQALRQADLRIIGFFFRQLCYICVSSRS